jgi:hypothetical protein
VVKAGALPVFLRLRAADGLVGTLLLEATRVRRAPEAGETLEFGGYTYRLLGDAVPPPVRERVEVGPGEVEVGLVYTCVAAVTKEAKRIQPMTQTMRDAQSRPARQTQPKPKQQVLKVRTGDGRPVTIDGAAVVVAEDAQQPSEQPAEQGGPRPPVAEPSPLEREAAAGFSIRWGEWNRSVGCPVTGVQIPPGERSRWRVFQGMAALSDAAAAEQSPALNAWTAKLNQDPESHRDKEFGLLPATLCANSSHQFDGAWYDVDRRGPFEVASNVKYDERVSHLPPELATELAPRLAKFLAEEVYHCDLPRRPKAEPPKPTEAEVAARRKAVAEQRAVNLLSPALGSTASARRLLDALRAMHVPMDLDALADGAR